MNNSLDHEPYTVIGDNMIKTCMHCHPGDSILRLFPDMDGVEISHGICSAHLAQAKREIVLLKLARAKAALALQVVANS